MPRLVTRITGRLKPAAAIAAIATGTDSPDAVREALQEESRDREYAERENDQDQQRQTSGVDPQKQAAEAVVAVGLGREILADESR